MPKIIEYPRASFKNSLQLAKAVDDLGGSCDIKTAAEKMGKKLSGGFTALTSAASKFGFIKMTKGTLSLEQTYKNYKLAYDEEEKTKVLRKSFLSVPLFKRIYDKYQDVKLPLDLLDKVLIREFGVEEKMASRAAGYFVDAAKQVKLLNPDNSFNSTNEKGNLSVDETEKNEEASGLKEEDNFVKSNKPNNYVVQIRGPNINQTIEIEEADHITLVEAAMNIIKKKLTKKEQDENSESSN